MNNKCPNCHGEIKDNKLCKLCGYDIDKSCNTNGLTGGFIKISKLSSIVLVILLILIIVSYTITDLVEMSECAENILTMIPTIILGGLLIWMSILVINYAMKMKKLFTSGETVNGEVIDYSEVKRLKLSLSVPVPIIEYKVGNDKYRVVANTGKSNKVGDKVAIKYDPSNPHMALPEDLTSKYKMITLCGIGFVVLAIVIVVFLFI